MNLNFNLLKSSILSSFTIFILIETISISAQSVRYEKIANFEGASTLAMGQAKISDNARSIAIVERSPDGEYVRVNGVSHQKYNKIIKGTMSWSKNGKSLVYVGERLGEQYIVRDQNEIKVNGRINPTGFYKNPVFSTDGSDVMWITTEKEGMSVFLNNNRLSLEQSVGEAHFIPSTTEIIYVTRKNCNYQLIDTRKIVHPFFEMIKFPILFSTIDNNYWYNAKTIEKNVLVNQNGEIVIENESIIYNPTISPDGKRIGFVYDDATAGGEKYVVKITGLPDYQVFDVFAGNSNRILFSPDSKNVLFTVYDNEGENSGMRVVLNNQKSKLWRFVVIESLLWSLEGLHYAYVAQNNDEKFYVISDSDQSIGYDNIDSNSLTFSPNGNYLAYLAKISNEDKISVFVNHKAIASFDEFSILKLLPNGDPIIVAKVDGKPIVQIGEKKILLNADQAYENTLKVLTDNSLELLARENNVFSIVFITW